MPEEISVKKYSRVLLALCVLFIVVQVPLVWNGGSLGVFNSPDATANYHFARGLFEGRGLAEPARDIGDVSEFLFMRSSRITGGFELPVGFFGLVLLYGFISKLLFMDLIPYLTVVAAAGGVYAFFQILREFFPGRIAFISALLLMVHPAWWYYTNDSLFPNVLFISSALFCLWLLVSGSKRSSRNQLFCSGLLCGIALLVRGIELVWFLPLVATCMIVLQSRIRPRTAALFAFGAVFPVAAAIIYVGSTTPLLFPFGYAVGSASDAGLAETFSPFAFHPRLIAQTGWNYLVKIFWPYALLSGIGIFSILLGKPLQKKWIWWTGATAALSAVLLVLYGSWRIIDHPNSAAVTIGTSYVRYFLPIYIFSIPFAALVLDNLPEFARKSAARMLRPFLGMSLLVFLWHTAITGSDESILAKQATLKGYSELAAWVVGNIPHDAVIVTDKSDKYVWPHRTVITSYQSDAALAALEKLVREDRYPVFFMGREFFPDIPGVDAERLSSFGLSLAQPLHRQYGIAVYPLQLLNDN